MSSSSSSSSSDKRCKGPSLVPEDFAAWEMQVQAHVGYAEWKLFQKVEPVVDEPTSLLCWMAELLAVLRLMLPEPMKEK